MEQLLTAFIKALSGTSQLYTRVVANLSTSLMVRNSERVIQMGKLPHLVRQLGVLWTSLPVVKQQIVAFLCEWGPNNRNVRAFMIAYTIASIIMSFRPRPSVKRIALADKPITFVDQVVIPVSSGQAPVVREALRLHAVTPEPTFIEELKSLVPRCVMWAPRRVRAWWYWAAEVRYFFTTERAAATGVIAASTVEWFPPADVSLEGLRLALTGARENLTNIEARAAKAGDPIPPAAFNRAPRSMFGPSAEYGMLVDYACEAGASSHGYFIGMEEAISSALNPRTGDMAQIQSRQELQEFLNRVGVSAFSHLRFFGYHVTKGEDAIPELREIENDLIRKLHRDYKVLGRWELSVEYELNACQVILANSVLRAMYAHAVLCVDSLNNSKDITHALTSELLSKFSSYVTRGGCRQGASLVASFVARDRKGF